MRASWNLSEGGAFSERLSVLRVLGGGSRYEVFLAVDADRQCEVVVKALRRDRTSSDRARAALAFEAATLQRVAHPHIARVLDVDLHGPRPHLVMQRHAGETVRQWLRVRRLANLEIAMVAEQVASAVHALAHAGVVHLDVKPSNVLLGDQATLIDLSIARTVEEADAVVDAFGTGPYMAPEQIAPGVFGRPGPATDVWGLGMTIAAAVIGRHPFGRPNPDAGTAAERYPQLNGILPALKGPFAALIADCLRKDPAERPAAGEVRARAWRLRERIIAPREQARVS